MASGGNSSKEFLHVLRACADDIGIAMLDMRYLKDAFKVFEMSRKIANQCLKPAKCKLIPLNIEMSEELACSIKEWLEAHIPGWSNFVVTSSAKYLGFSTSP